MNAPLRRRMEPIMDKNRSRARTEGFTLIELMIVVSIIAILAAIAVPKFANVLRKANEGSSKGSLGAIRSTLSIYYGETEGQFPADLESLTIGGKFLQTLPQAKIPDYHEPLSTVAYPAVTDGGGWVYNNVMADANFGVVLVNCTHTDTRGSVWTAY